MLGNSAVISNIGGQFMPRNASGRHRPAKAKVSATRKRGPAGPLRLSQRRDPTKTSRAGADGPSGNRTFILFGADEYCNPRAARFSGTDPGLMATAAETMSLCLVEVKDPDLAAIAKKLPVGRLEANGRGVVPSVDPDVYEDLVFEAIGSHGPTYSKETPTGLPHAWDETAPGDLVIAHETREIGWWEAVVIARDGDLLTLRYRDYPKYGKFVRHRSAVALIQSGAQSA
jgi:hypothetical protein